MLLLTVFLLLYLLNDDSDIHEKYQLKKKQGILKMCNTENKIQWKKIMGIKKALPRVSARETVDKCYMRKI